MTASGQTTWLLLFVLGPAPVEVQQPAAPGRWALDWRAPPGCPERAEVVAGVRAYLPGLQDPSDDPRAAASRITADLSQAATGWDAQVHIDGIDGSDTRKFSADSCAELADAIALISAVALDPVVVADTVRAWERPPATEPVPVPAPVPASTPSPEPDPAPVAEPDPDTDTEPFDATIQRVETGEDDPPIPPPRSVRLGVGAAGTGGWGPATAGFAGVQLGFAVLGRRWRWELDGHYAVPRTLSMGDGRRGRMQGWAVGTRGCVVPALGARQTIELPVCGGLEAGQVLARGLEPTANARAGAQAWLAVLAGPGLRWVFIQRLALAVDVAAVAALTRGDFTIGADTLASLAPFGARASLGLEARF